MRTHAHYQGNARTVKRARLVWTPQLHKRFEEALEKLGHDKAVPKNIMQVRCLAVQLLQLLLLLVLSLLLNLPHDHCFKGVNKDTASRE
jgi:SHAQKYF class myb-like DNA-binding protein